MLKYTTYFEYKHFKDNKDFIIPDVIGDYMLGTTIQYMKGNTISYFNLLTKSQVSFEIDNVFPDYINLTVTTKDKRLFIIDLWKAYEFYVTTNSLKDKADMSDKRYRAAVVYESIHDNIYVMGGRN